MFLVCVYLYIYVLNIVAKRDLSYLQDTNNANKKGKTERRKREGPEQTRKHNGAKGKLRAMY